VRPAIRFCKPILFFAALALIPSMAVAQAAEDWLRLRLAKRPNVTWAQVEAAMMRIYRASDPDGNGITPADFATLHKISRARLRAAFIGNLLVHDLDGDGNVTREELSVALGPRAGQPTQSNAVQVNPTPEQISQVRDRLVSDALKTDLDRDGVISATEMRQAAETETPVWAKKAIAFPCLSTGTATASSRSTNFGIS
jgi:Ca2+-binding EF-hand superfamily protein